jgi:hypothetical protein
MCLLGGVSDEVVGFGVQVFLAPPDPLVRACPLTTAFQNRQ